MRLVSHYAAALAGLMLAVASVIGLCLVNPVPQELATNATPTGAAVAIETEKSPHSISELGLESREPPFKSLDASGLAELLGGPQVEAALRNPSKVTAALLTPKLGAPPATYALRSAEVDLPPPVAARFAELLLDPGRNRQMNAVKPCVPRYGLRLTFVRGDNRALAYFCFECATVRVESTSGLLGGSHFDSIEYDLLLAALDVFPADEKLLLLREEFRRRQKLRNSSTPRAGD